MTGKPYRKYPPSTGGWLVLGFAVAMAVLIAAAFVRVVATAW